MRSLSRTFAVSETKRFERCSNRSSKVELLRLIVSLSWYLRIMRDESYEKIPTGNEKKNTENGERTSRIFQIIIVYR